MLTKDLLRVSRAGGGYHPEFTGPGDRALAERVLDAYREGIGGSRGDLDDALETIERDGEDFKLVRGFAKLLEREATFETRAPLEPERARAAAFAAGESVGVVTEPERERALALAGEELSEERTGVADSLYADLDARQVLSSFEPRWRDGEVLCTQYDLSLAQTALFDATELRVRTSDPRALVSAIERSRLMYEIHRVDRENGDSEEYARRELVVTGPDRLFRNTRRYGTRFARVLRSVVTAEHFRLEATIDDRGTERELVLTDEDVRVPGVDPVVEVSYDSAVEAEFAGRFEALDLDWDLIREPEALETGSQVMIPDFAFEWKYGDFRVYFEIMGFWTPEYVEKKLSQLDSLENVEMLVAVDESLGVGEEIEARDARAIDYTKRVDVKPVLDALSTYEEDLRAESAAALGEELSPEKPVVTIAALADEHGVSERVIEGIEVPTHERVGRTFLRDEVLAELGAEIEQGMDLADVEDELDAFGIDETSAVLSALGYRIEWEGLTGGVIVAK